MRILAGLCLVSVSASAHPLGNFSVSHYARIEPSAGGIDVQYVIDFAEIPTSERFQEWGLERSSPRELIQRRAAEQARMWAAGIALRVNGAKAILSVRKTGFTISSGTGHLPLLRVVVEMHANAAPGQVEYEDKNFEGRAGWKEIVVAAGPGAHIQSSNPGDRDLSHALTMYPPDPAIAPPQDLRARLAWSCDPAPKISGKSGFHPAS